ncbi:MAG TPA: hypothetical protein VF350_03380 [Candidatus Bathyarchaeia archaeon]
MSIKTILELTEKDLEIRCELPRAGDIKDSYADISKAKSLLGYEPKFTLRNGFRAMI